MYLERDDALGVIERMRIFENALKASFEDQGYDLRENLGRRNILMSMSQEKETANILRKKFKDVESDGAPGKPDVVIHDINKEVECKLTSGSRSKGNISFSLQTDWETLKKKKHLDYSYILCNDNFDEFCFILFEGLTVDDFFPPAKSSRGKARMNKAKAMRKARFLVGGVENIGDKHIANINREYKTRSEDMSARITELAQKRNNLGPNANAAKDKIDAIINSEYKRHVAALNKLTARKKYWEDNPKYSFKFERVYLGEKKKTVTLLSRLKGFLLKVIGRKG